MGAMMSSDSCFHPTLGERRTRIHREVFEEATAMQMLIPTCVLLSLSQVEACSLPGPLCKVGISFS